MFELTKSEIEVLVSQAVIPNKENLTSQFVISKEIG